MIFLVDVYNVSRKYSSVIGFFDLTIALAHYAEQIIIMIFLQNPFINNFCKDFLRPGISSLFELKFTCPKLSNKAVIARLLAILHKLSAQYLLHVHFYH